MTRDNVGIVKDLYAMFKRGDIPAMLERLAPDATWAMVGRAEDVPMAGLRHGRAGATDFFRLMGETVEIRSFEPQTFLAAEDKVFIWGHWSWTMRGTGISGENEWLHVFTFRDDGMVSSWRGHNDTALLAAALRGEPQVATKKAVAGVM